VDNVVNNINPVEDATYNIIKHDLARFLPIRIVLKKTDTGWAGLVENSFSMDPSSGYVRIWWSGKAYSILGEHDLNGIKDAEHNAKDSDYQVFDPLSDDCPVEVNWAIWRGSTTKYYQRNAPFKVK
jgi:hypothetical protein